MLVHFPLSKVLEPAPAKAIGSDLINFKLVIKV